MILRKTQQLEIINYANEVGIDPRIFQVELIPERRFFFGLLKFSNTPETIIRIKGTPYYFSMKTELNTILNFYDIRMHFSPDKDMRENKHEFSIYKDEFSWNEIFGHFRYWVDCLKNELEAIRDWNKLMAIPDFIGSNHSYSSDYEDQFTNDEKLLLVESISKLKIEVIESFDLNYNEISMINKKLDDLISKVDNLNKFDFRSVFYGVLLNISSSILYDSAPLFWITVKGVFGNTFDTNTDLLV